MKHFKPCLAIRVFSVGMQAEQESSAMTTARTASSPSPSLAQSREAQLEQALQSMWTVATSLVEKNGPNGNDTMTDLQHAAWQKASALANALLGGVGQPQPPAAPTKPRVLVIVSGGIADYVADDVDVEVFDWDNYKDDPRHTDGAPEHFRDLAEPCNVPIGTAPGNLPIPT